MHGYERQLHKTVARLKNGDELCLCSLYIPSFKIADFLMDSVKSTGPVISRYERRRHGIVQNFR